MPADASLLHRPLFLAAIVVALFFLCCTLPVHVNVVGDDVSHASWQHVDHPHPSQMEAGVEQDRLLPNVGKVGKVYVTGVSSGAYMAGQLHVAYSSAINGAGLVAGGPYACSGGTLIRALDACTDDTMPLDFSALLSGAELSASSGLIDPLANMLNSPVWMFHGKADQTVRESVADAAAAWYRHFGADVLYNNATGANHAWVSPLGANPCSISASPYTSQCGEMDPPMEMLAHILRRPISAANNGTLQGLLSFSQDAYSTARWGLVAQLLSMDTTGYVYVPAACSNGSLVCDVIVVLHGCLQGAALVGQDLINEAHMNQYADTNGLIVLYPQAIPLTLGAVYNPKGCWDWWGYLAADGLFAVKGSYQMEVIMAMIEALGSRK